MKKNTNNEMTFTITEVMTAVIKGLDDFIEKTIDDAQVKDMAVLTKLAVSASIISKLTEGAND